MNARQSVAGFEFQRYNQEYLSRVASSATGANGTSPAANDATHYGVRVVPAEVTPGQDYWRVIGVHHLTPAENTGKHNLYAELLDEAGQRVRDPDFQLAWGWEGQRPDEAAPPARFDKGDNEPATNIPIDRNQKLWAHVAGDLPSDKVENLHTKHADEPGPNGELWNSIGHHSFYVIFQRTRHAAAPVTPDVPDGADTTRPVTAVEHDATYVEGRDAIPALAIMQPGQRFEQVWHIRNTGSKAWDESYRVTCVGGKPLNAPTEVPTLPCAPDHEIAVIVPFIAPSQPGAYHSVWRMTDADGTTFGERLWLVIQVAAPERPPQPAPPPPPGSTPGSTPGPTPRNVRPTTTTERVTARTTDQAPDQAAERLPEQSGSGSMRDPELYAAWKKHIENGFENNQTMFQQLLRGFLNPYWTTVWMYRILFGLGVASFLVAAALSAFAGKEGYTLIFGGISALSLLAYFFNRPLQALEENLQFITWLGLIYNSYWTRLLYLNSLPDAQKGLEDATNDAIKRIKELMDAHSKRAGRRQGLGEG